MKHISAHIKSTDLIFRTLKQYSSRDIITLTAQLLRSPQFRENLQAPGVRVPGLGRGEEHHQGPRQEAQQARNRHVILYIYNPTIIVP